MSRKSRHQIHSEFISHLDVESMIFLIRHQRVMIDRDLAQLYGVETKYLNRQVRRNRDRFPEEFMFQLSRKERNELVTNWHRLESLKHSSFFPYAFTENGVAMLASVLNSERAVKISIHIIKTFVKLRRWVATQKELVIKLRELEAKVEQHDQEITGIVHALQELIDPQHPSKSKPRIGFHSDPEMSIGKLKRVKDFLPPPNQLKFPSRKGIQGRKWE